METSITATNGMESVERYIADSVADNTTKGYGVDMKTYVTWCEGQGLDPLPALPTTVAKYFAYLSDSGKKVSTIERAKAAIHAEHDKMGYADPTSNKGVRATLQGIRRNNGTNTTKKAPVLCEDVLTMVDTLPDKLIGKRDRALLLVGFAGAFRRSELAGLEVSDLDFSNEGLKIHLAFSKTDQEGKGRDVGILRGNGHCPVRALEEWLAAAGITAGPVFRNITKGGALGAVALTPQSVALIVKKTAAAAGLDSKKYAGHSLRAGFVTESANNGANVKDIMRTTGHTNVDTVMGYIRRATIFDDNASGKLGL